VSPKRFLSQLARVSMAPLTAFPIMLLSACSDGTEQTRQAVEAGLADRRDVQYRDLMSYPGEVVCGEFNPRHPTGGHQGFRRFVVIGGRADTRPDEADWSIYCSDDPAAGLFEKTGIGPPGGAGESLEQVRTDLLALQTAVEAYLADNHLVPTTRQGLQALVTASEQMPVPRNFRQGGYLETLPQDPWGRPYRYESNSLGGVAPTFRIFTLGADGEPGGRGERADIGNWQLEYLEHIAGL
jgi:general secretion pathway protein G